MFVRRCVAGLLGFGLVGVLAGCGNPQGLDSVSVSPTSQTLTVGQTAQFSATGTYGNAGHASTQNITDGVIWSSSTPGVATISATGLATAVGSGTATITASAAGYAGPVVSSATLMVSGGSGGVAGGSITSISVIPGAQSLGAPGATGQFLAIGTTSSGATVDLTGQVAWSSSSSQIATVGATTGLATAVAQGSVTIAAIYANSGGTVVTGQATLTVSGGTTEKYTAVTITPGSEALSASGQTGQFIALGTSGTTGLETDVTNSSQIKWSSSIPTVASVSATGLATGLSVGTAEITAELTNPDGTVVSSSAPIAVSATPAPEPLLSLTIIPSDIGVGNLQDTGQFLAIGTFSTAPYVRDLTNSSAWLTSAPNVFPVTTDCNPSSSAPSGSTSIQCAPLTAGSQNGGVVTAYGNGTATIIAEAAAADGSIQTATATFDCPLTLPNPNGDPPTPGTCYPGSQAYALLATLTVYNEGLDSITAGNWLVTAPSATGTPNVVHCGPGWTGAGGSVCTATYPLVTGSSGIISGPTIILEAQGGNFGGWSYSCTPSDVHGNPLPGPTYYTQAGPNYCTVTFGPIYDSGGNFLYDNTNATVGAIFN